MSAMSFSLVLPLLLRVGGNELLDYVQTAAYWQSKGVPVTVESMTSELKPQRAATDGDPDIAALVKQLGDDDYDVRERAQKKLVAAGPAARDQVAVAAKSDDPEVAHRARTILQALARPGQAGPMAAAVRRLMAIRTLGELKNAKALPVLRTLLKAKETFVADYAGRAIATIEGKADPRGAASDAADDVWLLPAGCALVGQIRLPRGGTAPLAKILADAGPVPGPMTPEQVAEQMNRVVLAVAERVGNVRLDTITVGVSGDTNRRNLFIVAIARGLFDADAAKAALRATSPSVPPLRIGDVEAFTPGGDRDASVLVASNRCVALVTGPSHRGLPVHAVAQALVTGTGAVRNDAKLAQLIRSVDRKQPLWAVAAVTESYRQIEYLAPFDTATLAGRRQGERLNLSLTARGTDPQRVAATVAKLNAAVGAALAAMKGENVPAVLAKPIVAFLGSVRARADGATAQVTASLTGSPVGAALPFLMGVRTRGGRHREGPPRGRVAKVSGTVTWQGKPVAFGSVTLVPDRAKNNKGRAATGAIKNGKFILTTYGRGDGALVGWHRIELSYPKGNPIQMRMDEVVDLGDRLPAIYRGSESVLSVEIKPGVQNVLKMVLPRKQDKPLLEKEAKGD